MATDAVDCSLTAEIAVRLPVIDRPALPACMGGWCTVRDRCAQHLTMSRRVVVERMCERGNETPVPVRNA